MEADNNMDTQRPQSNGTILLSLPVLLGLTPKEHPSSSSPNVVQSSPHMHPQNSCESVPPFTDPPHIMSFHCDAPPDYRFPNPQKPPMDALQPTTWNLKWLDYSPFPYLPDSQTMGDPPLSLGSISSSPKNFVDSDNEFLLHNKTLELSTLTIHRPCSPTLPMINPHSAPNITMRRRHNWDN